MLAAGSILPSPPIIHKMMAIDTIVHTLLYAFLAFVPMLLLNCRKTAFLVSIAITPLGYILETIHMHITGHSFNAVNALANNIGVLSGIGIGFIIRLNNHYEQRKECTTGSDKKNISKQNHHSRLESPQEG
jgi:hypothetical protein